MKLTTTLNRIHSHEPCVYGWRRLRKHLREQLGTNLDPDAEIDLVTILDSNGADDTLWALRATIQENAPVFVAIAFAERVLPIFESRFPDDVRPRKAIEAAAAAANAADAAVAADEAAYKAYEAAHEATYAADEAYEAAHEAADTARPANANATYHAARSAAHAARAAAADYHATAATAASVAAYHAAAADYSVCAGTAKDQRAWIAQTLREILEG